MSQKYSFKLDRIKSSVYHRPLYRMMADEEIPEYGVSICDMGGLVTNPHNIINSWVSEGSMVIDEAKIENCCIDGETYIKNNVIIHGNGNKLGGDYGPVLVRDNVVLDMKNSINIGPLNIGGSVLLTGDNDIISFCGLLSNKDGNLDITAYKDTTSKNIYCSIQDKHVDLLDLPKLYSNELSSASPEECLAVLKFAKHLINAIKAYFNILV